MSEAGSPSATPSAPIEDNVFRFRHAVAVRFRDLDPMGHAHHTLPLIYLEEARAEYWRSVAGRSVLADIDYVMAEVTVRFQRRIEWPGRLEVRLRTRRIGNKSIEMDFEIADEAGQIASSGHTVLVMYDYAGGRSRSVPAELRARLEAWEADRDPGAAADLPGAAEGEADSGR